MYVVRGRLDPEVGAALMRAVEAASDALFAETSGDGEESGPGGEAGRGGNSEKPPEPAQLRADAVGLLAERALAAGFVRDSAPVSGSRAERYQVVLHVEAATLTEEGEPGQSELEDGTRVSAETARRLACDSGLVRVAHDADGSVLDVGRKTRTIPPALRRALEARDRGCRFPGCGLRFTDAHHIVHWADGGETKLMNILLLCRAHHRRVHEGGYQVCSDRNGQVVFFTPKGKALFEAPPPPELPPDPVEALVRGNRTRGITPDCMGGAPRWNRDRDVPWAIEAAAMEALDPWDEPMVDEETRHEETVSEASVHEAPASESPVPETPAHEAPIREPSVHRRPSTTVPAEIAAASSTLTEAPNGPHRGDRRDLRSGEAA